MWGLSRSKAVERLAAEQMVRMLEGQANRTAEAQISDRLGRAIKFDK
jgi:hypothetical protein